MAGFKVDPEAATGQSTMVRVLAALGARDDDAGSLSLGTTLDSPSRDVKGEDKSDMTSPPMLEPTALQKSLSAGLQRSKKGTSSQKPPTFPAVSDSWNDLDEGTPSWDAFHDPWLAERMLKSFRQCYPPNRNVVFGKQESGG
jgi:hypothetical protein